MTDTPVPSITVPTPTTGPTPRLQLNDPATILGIVGTLAVALTKLIPVLTGGHSNPIIVAAGMLADAFYLSYVVGKKHDLLGTLAAIAPAAVQLTEAVAPNVDPNALATVQADLLALKAQVDAIPTDQRQAVLDTLGSLVAHPGTVMPADGPPA